FLRRQNAVELELFEIKRHQLFKGAYLSPFHLRTSLIFPNSPRSGASPDALRACFILYIFCSAVFRSAPAPCEKSAPMKSWKLPSESCTRITVFRRISRAFSSLALKSAPEVPRARNSPPAFPPR